MFFSTIISSLYSVLQCDKHSLILLFIPQGLKTVILPVDVLSSSVLNYVILSREVRDNYCVLYMIVQKFTIPSTLLCNEYELLYKTENILQCPFAFIPTHEILTCGYQHIAIKVHY